MKITTSKEKFVKELQTIQSGMNVKNGTLPILQNFLIETEENGVRVVFTDLEMAIKHFIPVTVVEAGSVTVPIKKFMEIINNLGSKDEITISTDEAYRITIQSGKARFKMGGTKKDEYPSIPEIDSNNSFIIPALKSAEMINATLFSASTESDRPFLNGLLWKYTGGQFSMVATDGRRLAVKTINTIKSSNDFSVIVPLKVLNELTKFIKSAGLTEENEMQVSISANQIGFVIGKTSFVSRLTEGTYPAYEQIIPQSHEIEIKTNSDDLLTVTKRAAICSSDHTNKVKYTLKNGTAIINAASQTMDFEEEIPIEYSGDEFQICFNPDFIMDILKNIPSSQVIIQFKTSSSPALIKTQAEDSPIYIVMPLRM